MLKMFSVGSNPPPQPCWTITLSEGLQAMKRGAHIILENVDLYTTFICKALGAEAP